MRALIRWRYARLLAALTVDLFWVGGPGGAPPVPQHTSFQEAFAAAVEAQERNSASLLSQPGVVGTAVALAPNGQPVVKVYLSAMGAAAIPASFGSVGVVTEVTGEIVSLDQLPMTGHGTAEASSAGIDPRGRFARPVPIGVSSGQASVTAGTIGARVTDGSDVFALSNNHVFAARNDARIGDHILQPGVADGGRDPTHAIGSLADFEPIRFCDPFPTCPDNRIDAAIAATSKDHLGSSTPDNGYGSPRSEPLSARLGLQVQKYGRTTVLTTGRVSGVNAILNVNYGNGVARFVDQIVIGSGTFSSGGDSGSLVVTKSDRDADDRRPVGLLFAGSNTTSIVNPIDLVLERFAVTVDGS